MLKGHFKGRVIEINGSKITIDVTAESRTYKDPKTKEVKEISSVWEKPDMPKISDVVRCIFHRRD